MPKLLIATTNQAKLEESRRALEDSGLELLSLKDFPNIQPVEEIGTTFEENALLKAKGYFEQTQIPCLGDDGGLEIVYLGGLPGPNSRRWVGENATDRDLAEEVLKRLRGVPREKRGARLGTCNVFYDSKHILKKDSWVEGYIAEKLMTEIQPGFPYRSILMIPEFNKSYGRLTKEEHEAVNFRQKNLNALKPEIMKLLADK